MQRAELVASIATIIADVSPGHPCRVAIDGVDCAGKTTLADEVAHALRSGGRPVIRAGIDGFHRPRQERYRRGPDDPRGYYEDSFDLRSLRGQLLDPLEDPGCTRVRTAVFDYLSDAPVDGRAAVTRDSVLLFDGVFLLRVELVDAWDLTIFLQVDFDTTVGRAARRDASLFGSPEAVIERYRSRYVPGQQIYLREVDPAATADLVIDNTDPSSPRLLRTAV